ncbi:MAG TPA: hypothetical protein VGN75_04630, partial [Kaistia sp.]|nr:hypothetical protein [Kaistia sp.]
MTASPVAILRARKLAEAERYLSAWTAGPLLAAEATATNTHAAILARAIVSKAEAEAQDMARIEIRRQATQAAIRSAPHPAAIEAAL